MASQERRGIISAGTWTLDRIKIVDAWPQEEHLAQIIATDMQGGGSGHNLAIDMSRLDPTIPVEAIGLLGADTDGDFLIDQAKAAGINTSQLHRSDLDQTSFTDVVSDKTSGKRTFFHYPGTSDLLSPNHFNFDISSARLLHLGLLGVHKIMDSAWQGFENGWVAVLAAAKTCGINTNLELVSIAENKIQTIATPCLPYLDSLIINEYELSALSGIQVSRTGGRVCPDLCKAAATILFERGSMSLIVVHYPEAALALTNKGESIFKPSYDVHASWIKSSVGAGDAFASGMLCAMHQGWTLDASLGLAHAAAAASLRAVTTVGSVESIEHCLEFAKNANKKRDYNG